MKDRLVPALIVLALTGTGLWLVFFCWSEIRTASRLDRDSAVIEGRVIGDSARGVGRSGQSSTLVVEYVPPGNPAIRKSFDVDGATYRSAVDTGRVRVTYLPEEPRVSLVTRFAVMPYQILMGFSILILMAGLALLWRLAKGIRSERR